MHCYQTIFNCCKSFSVQNSRNKVFITYTLKQWFTVALTRICFSTDTNTDFFFRNIAQFLLKKNCKENIS